MAAAAVYLDECVAHDLVNALRARGYSATSALEQGLASISESDDAQLAFATAYGWRLLTHNERHFHALAQEYRRRGESHSGIVVVPARPPFERLVIRSAMLLDWISTMPDHQSGFFKWGTYKHSSNVAIVCRATSRRKCTLRLRGDMVAGSTGRKVSGGRPRRSPSRWERRAPHL
jgi:hypothetical protein